MTRGRPTKYRDTYPEQVRKHLAQGYTLASWAATINVTRDCVYKWSLSHANFLYAIKAGRAQGQLVWEKRLERQAIESSGNTAAIIFAMKNLYRDDWTDKMVSELTGRDGGPIEIKETSAAECLKAFIGRIASADDAESG